MASTASSPRRSGMSGIGRGSSRTPIGSGAIVKRSAPPIASKIEAGVCSRVGREIVAYEVDRPDVDRGSAPLGAAAERQKAIGDDVGAGELADRLVDVGELGSDESSRLRQLLDGIGDEWQRPTGERVTD